MSQFAKQVKHAKHYNIGEIQLAIMFAKHKKHLQSKFNPVPLACFGLHMLRSYFKPASRLPK